MIASSFPALAEVRIGVSLTGGDKELRGEIINVLSSYTLLQEGDEDPQSIVAAAQADYRRIVAALYDQGHYGPTVSIRLDGREADAISPFAVPPRIGRIDVLVNPGPRFTFGQAEVAPIPRGTVLPDGFARGRTAKLTRITDAGKAGIESWRDVGYAKVAPVSQRVAARHPQNQLDVSIRLDPGRQLKFGNLVIRGNEDVRTERIREIAGLPRGEIFHPDEIKKASTRLQRTGAFSVVSLNEAEQANADGRLDIIADLTEQKPRRFGFGAELTTLEGGTVSAYWLHRNLLGGAERLRIDGEIANLGVGGDNGVDYRLSLLFGRPGTFNPDTDFYLRAALEHEDEPLYLADSFEIEGGINRIVNEEYEFQVGVGLLYSSTEDDLGEREFTLLTLPGIATLDRRDDPLDATTGYYVNLELKPFVGLDGSGTGARIYADARGYRSFGTDDRFTLAGRLQLGSVVGTDVTETVPDFLFYSGGGGTVRGQGYQSLGVTLPGGEEIGGRSFLGASVELRGQINEKIELVGFYDWGTVGADSMPGDGESHAGAGFGIRYDTGIGPIRLDVATPVSGPGSGGGVELYIGIGQAF